MLAEMLMNFKMPEIKAELSDERLSGWIGRSFIAFIYVVLVCTSTLRLASVDVNLAFLGLAFFIGH